MTSLPFRLKSILPLSLLLIAANGLPGRTTLADLLHRKQQIQQTVVGLLPKQFFYLPAKYLYAGQPLVVKAYPVCFFAGSAATLRQNFDISTQLALDTTSAYAAIYVRDSLKLAVHKAYSSNYGFYPVNPPEKNVGPMGSRSLTDYDIVLEQAAAKHSDTAFFVDFSAFEAVSRMPTTMAFFEQGILHFIDEDGKEYPSFLALVNARYGGRRRFIYQLAREEQVAAKKAYWLVTDQAGERKFQQLVEDELAQLHRPSEHQAFTDTLDDLHPRIFKMFKDQQEQSGVRLR